ncbi:MAG: glutamine synthetase family protein [Candidatus Omnitrophota bacterium]
MKKKLTKKDVARIVKDKKIKNIHLWFTDILGNLKCCTITNDELADVLDHNKGFDGSSVAGFAEAEESDILAKPDPSTFQILPWEGEDGAVGRMFCDILNPDGSPYTGDPRYALKRNIERARKMGFTFYIGAEVEYFYFKRHTSPELLDEGHYFDVIPNDLANKLRKKTIDVLKQVGIQIETAHHEVAPSQHEIDPRYCEALEMADKIMTFKLVIKEVAQQHGVYASFMPKPIFGENGSGMHTHQSLFRGKSNAFFSKSDKYYLSTVAKQFIAGQLKHAREICAITAQWVNSYKRLVPGYEAPVYISWAQKNRTTLIRIPVYRPGNRQAMRAELRCPDPACNPYLAFAVMLAAGLEGIEKKYKLPDPIEPNIYKMEMPEREARGLKSLPVNLFEAIKETERSKLVKDALGEHIHSRFLYNKIKEWEEDRIQVTSHEIKKYLPVL